MNIESVEHQFDHLSVDEQSKVWQKKAIELQKRVEHLQMFVRSTSDCFWNWDMVNNEVERSISFERAFGYRRNEIHPGIEWWIDRLHIEDKERILNAFETACKQGLPKVDYRYRFRRRDDGYAIIDDHVCIIRNDKGEVVRSLGAMKDISDLVLVENERNTQTQILNIMREGAYLIRADDGIIVYTNPAFEQMFGYDEGEMTGQHVSIVNAPTDKALEEVAQEIINDLNHKGVWRGEVKNIKKDGTHFWCSASATECMHSEYGRVWISVHVDITEQKHKDAQLRQALKMEALGKLTGGIAHDYNNMLGVILGYSELLCTELAGDAKLKHYADKIKDAGQHSSQLTKKLLNFARKEQGSELTTVNINHLLKDNLNLLEKTLTVNITLDLCLAEDLWYTLLDASEFLDSIINLSINAMHAIDTRGTITITTENVIVSSQLGISLNLAQGEYCLLKMTDTGCGIAKENIDKVFDPFFSTKGKEGTGLGLSQVYGFMHRNLGTIKVESVPGQGSCFSLYFPKTERILQEKEVVSECFLATGASDKKILVVDDEPDLMELTCEVLRMANYKVTGVTSGTDALAFLSSNRVDLLISDILLPQMNGYELAKIVKEQYPHIKIQLISGHSELSNNVIDQKLQEDVLLKPFMSAELIAKVKSHIN